jgi:hypothetical protein
MKKAIDKIKCFEMAVLSAILCLGFDYLFTLNILKYIAIIVLLSVFIYPLIFKPIVYVLLQISAFMGYFISKFVLLLVFYLLITPIGSVRRIMGFDDLNIKGFKNDSLSAMLVINKDETDTNLKHQF